MTSVGVRELKAHLSAYLRRVKKGEALAITEHGHAIATLTPSTSANSEKLWRMVRAGMLEWEGGKPTGLAKRIPCRGRLASEMIIEDREDRI
jgi:prevent-host-death family protein